MKSFCLHNGNTKIKNESPCLHIGCINYLIYTAAPYTVLPTPRKITVRFNNVLHNVLLSNSVKEDIAAFFKIPCDSFFLSNNGFPVESLSTVQANSVLIVSPRLRGGAPPSQCLPKQLCLFLDADGTPTSWFRIFESRTAQVSKARADLLLDSLTSELIAELSVQIADALDSDTAYESLKTIILKKYASTQSSAIQKLGLTHAYAGQPPSKFLQQIVRTLETIHPGLSDNRHVLSHQFLSALPHHLQISLATVDSDDPFHLAKIADKLVALQPGRPHNVQLHSVPPSDSQPHISAVSTSRGASTQHVHPKTFRQPQPHQDSNETQHDSSRQATNIPRQSSTLICSFHKTNGADSRKCCIGCSWAEIPSSVMRLSLCIYHNIFGHNAYRCLDGCDFRSRSRNTQKN